MAAESSMPITPAASVMTRASSKNCQRMCDFFAPSARRRPISRTRSSTETSMIFFTAKHGDGALVIRREVLAVGDGSAKLLHGVRFKIRRDGFEEHHAGVAR